uniref:Delta/omega-plectoxin-Pt1a n=1 Tax=Plectreurys tristis TaxID=33319 RepID=TX21A_PLETR|nr:RecName: Full=Delta/omega-plectoxin-Pt1a; Short=Delta/omega-PLTX-Pt1a; Flags: Precursor [Plectreurys tristis]
MKHLIVAVVLLSALAICTSAEEEQVNVPFRPEERIGECAGWNDNCDKRSCCDQCHQCRCKFGSNCRCTGTKPSCGKR